MNWAPLWMASSTSEHSSASRFSMAFSPLSTRYSARSVTVGRRPLEVSKCWILASSSLSITGKSSEICLACSGVAVSRLSSGPRPDFIDVTTSSRIESSGGLVTWANCCVK